jgi:hypothetical protein
VAMVPPAPRRRHAQEGHTAQTEKRDEGDGRRGRGTPGRRSGARDACRGSRQRGQDEAVPASPPNPQAVPVLHHVPGGLQAQSAAPGPQTLLHYTLGCSLCGRCRAKSTRGKGGAPTSGPTPPLNRGSHTPGQPAAISGGERPVRGRFLPDTYTAPRILHWSSWVPAGCVTGVGAGQYSYWDSTGSST